MMNYAYNIMTVAPSSYKWMLPDSAEISSIEQLARDGLFPSIADFYPAVVYAFLFGLARTMLHTAVFKVTQLEWTCIDMIVDWSSLYYLTLYAAIHHIRVKAELLQPSCP